MSEPLEPTDLPPPGETPGGGGSARASEPPASIDSPVESREQTEAWIDEAELALSFGFSREILAELRHDLLGAGFDWVLSKKRVLIGPAGIEKIQKALALEEEESEPSGPPEGLEQGSALLTFAVGENGHQEAAGAQDGAAISLIVTHVPKMNRRILCARKKEEPGGAEVRVRVKDNAHFLPGMEFRGRRDPHYGDVYNLEGRCPRFRGRW